MHFNKDCAHFSYYDDCISPYGGIADYVRIETCGVNLFVLNGCPRGCTSYKSRKL